MSFKDKVSNKVEQLRGKGKEALGSASDSPKLEGEGKRDQTSAAVKDAGEHLKDAAGKAKEAAEHAAEHAKDVVTGD